MKITDKIKQQIIDLYLTNKYTKKAIAEQIGCSVDSVTRTLQKNNLMETKLSQKLLDIYDKVVEEYQQGSYCKDLAIKYGVEDHSIYKILDKAGIKRQTGYHSNCIENYFEKIDTPNKAYLLGFITADGAIVNDILSIEIHKNDIELLEFAKSEINPQATITPTRNCVKITFSAKQLSKDLKKYGIIQNKSKIIEKIPIEYLSDELLPFYFRGLLDGDGCIHQDGKISFYSGSLKFIEDIQKILIQKLNLSELKIYQGTTYFITWGSKQDKIKLFNYLYSNLNDTFYYKRKYNRLYNYVNTEVTN